MLTEHEEFILIDGHSLFVKQLIVNPANPTLIFLHEALGSVAQWRDFPRKIAENTGFNCLVYDRLGHGQSDAVTEKRTIHYLHHEAWEVLPSVVTHFKIENPILLGHSDGGTIALLFAARFKTKKIIVEAAHIFVENVTLEGIQKTIKNLDFLTERLERYHGKKAENLLKAWYETWLDPSFREWNIESEIKNSTCPTLIIQGKNDEYGTENQVLGIKNNIGEYGEILLIPNCGHTPHREAESIVLQAVIDFLK